MSAAEIVRFIGGVVQWPIMPKLQVARHRQISEFFARRTVYPTRNGGFPPASFWTVAAEYSYMQDVQLLAAHNACGVCSCPAPSFTMYWNEVLNRVKY